VSLQLASEAHGKQISTRIVVNRATRSWDVVSSDPDVIPTLRSAARQWGVTMIERGDGAVEGSFPAGAELGPDAWSPRAKEVIEFGFSVEPSIEARPIPQQIIEEAVMADPGRSVRGPAEQVGPVVPFSLKGDEGSAR
jgi:hypothetical protein